MAKETKGEIGGEERGGGSEGVNEGGEETSE